MNSKKVFSKLFLVAAIVISGCATYNNIYSNYDKSVDFIKYKTYAWINSNKSPKPALYFNDVIEDNTKSHIDHQFKDRGYTVDTIKPDVLLELVLKSKKKKEVVQTSNPFNYSNYTYYNYPYNHFYHNNFYYGNQFYNFYRNYNYSIPYSYYQGYRTKTIKYTQSTITINVIDRASNKLVWTGSAEGDIYDPQYLKGEINPAIGKILNLYPVKPI